MSAVSRLGNSHKPLEQKTCVAIKSIDRTMRRMKGARTRKMRISNTVSWKIVVMISVARSCEYTRNLQGIFRRSSRNMYSAKSADKRTTVLVRQNL